MSESHYSPSPGAQQWSAGESLFLEEPGFGPAGPVVTVVIPCYNYGQYLKACVSSVLSQLGVSPRVVIVDDASTDGSAALAEALAHTDPRVRVLRHAENQGHIKTYNHGLAEAVGDFVLLLSADDLLPPGALRRATDLFEQHPNVGMVYGHPRNFTGSPPDPVTRLRGWSVWSGADWISGRCRRGRNPIYSPEVLLRLSIQRKVGEYRSDLPHSADLEMWLRVASISDVARINGPDQAFRRVHGENMSETTFAGELADLVERARAFDAFFAGYGKELPDAARQHMISRHSVAREILDYACSMATRGDDRDAIQHSVRVASELSDVSKLAEWRELQWRLDGRESFPIATLRGAFALRREIRARVHWRRWRRSGV